MKKNLNLLRSCTRKKVFPRFISLNRKAMTMIEMAMVTGMLGVVAMGAFSIMQKTFEDSQKVRQVGQVEGDVAQLFQILQAQLSMSVSIDSYNNACGDGTSTTVVTVDSGECGVDNLCTCALNDCSGGGDDPILDFTFERGFSDSDPIKGFLLYQVPNGNGPTDDGILMLFRNTVTANPEDNAGSAIFFRTIAELRCRYIDSVTDFGDGAGLGVPAGAGEPGQGPESFRFWVTLKKRFDTSETWQDITDDDGDKPLTLRTVSFEVPIRNRALRAGGPTEGNPAVQYLTGATYFLKPRIVE